MNAIDVVDSCLKQCKGMFNISTEINPFFVLLQKEFSDVMTKGFDFGRLISQKKILWIHTAPKGFDPLYKKPYY